MISRSSFARPHFFPRFSWCPDHDWLPPRDAHGAFAGAGQEQGVVCLSSVLRESNSIMVSNEKVHEGQTARSITMENRQKLTPLFWRKLSSWKNQLCGYLGSHLTTKATFTCIYFFYKYPSTAAIAGKKNVNIPKRDLKLVLTQSDISSF